MATEQSLDTINNTNLKSIAEIPSWSMAHKTANDISHAKRTDQLVELSMQNMVNHQQRINVISETYIGRLCDNASSVDPTEAVATAKLFKGESDSAITSLLASLASGQIGVKAAQSTPPETGVTQLIAQLNALTSQNSANQSHVQNMNQATLVSMSAIAQVLAKLAQTTPDVTGKSTPREGT